MSILNSKPQIYLLTFTDGTQCTCIAMEPGSDEENIQSLKRSWGDKLVSVVPSRNP